MRRKVNILRHGNTYVPPPEEDTLVVALCPECQSPDLELDSQSTEKISHYTFYTTQTIQFVHCKSCNCRFDVNADHKRIHLYPSTKAWTLYVIGLLLFIALFVFFVMRESVLGGIIAFILGGIYTIFLAIWISDGY